MSAPAPSFATVETKASPATELVITTADGTRYDVRIALIVQGALDTGIKNPLDNMPIFNINMTTAIQITRKTDA
jgi:hypothetical protein